MSWYIKKGEAPPSPWRIVLVRPAVPDKAIECPRGTRTLDAAKRFARSYASNVGEVGMLLVQMRDVAGAYSTFAHATVKDSEAGRWVVP